ncbi:MAG: hypothetical protein KGI80_05100 [Verrucomicrobiota bacterium]|nr:hypothetical protein [Verrucomicrobiota bacterium]
MRAQVSEQRREVEAKYRGAVLWLAGEGIPQAARAVKWLGMAILSPLLIPAAVVYIHSVEVPKLQDWAKKIVDRTLTAVEEGKITRDEAGMLSLSEDDGTILSAAEWVLDASRAELTLFLMDSKVRQVFHEAVAPR